MMHMDQRLTQTQRQQLVLTQKMQQALHILQLSGLELEQYVQQELEANPFLEQVAKQEEVPEKPAETGPTKEDETSFEESFDLDAYAEKWDFPRKEGIDFSRNADLEERRQYYENSITQTKSLRAHLLDQLRLATETLMDNEIGERIIIGDTDNRGYFTGNAAEIAEELAVPEDDVKRVLRIIKRFEPTGMGAETVEECLLMQIEAEHPHELQLKELVRDHLDELKQRQIPKIAKAMGVSPERVEELKEILSALNPWPGHEYASDPPQYIQPEVVVEEVEGEFVVRLVNDRVPDLRINDLVQKQIRNEKMKQEERDYVRGKLESARWLQRNIAQRQQTILRVAQAIVNAQRDFLARGVEHIKPLKLQDIADEVGVHESTVARTTRGKYMQTPQGLFELKYFFSPGLMNDSGNSQSSKSVQALVKKVIDEEDKRKPLSDQK
ncbi:MAG: RNA polymerase factor sigma-54, partial [Candidatus Hydrogenedentes bacterium]|nr:RNA polymerase factor sigma-54 [Candidatus Hydrogenedentota bacterium]